MLLADTKRVVSEMRKCRDSNSTVTPEALSEWKDVTQRSNQVIARLARTIATQAERHRIEMAVFTEEVRQELVDREASAARTADRFRVLCERDGGSTHALFDRAIGSSTAVEAALASLCPHGPSLNHTSKALADRMTRHSRT